MWRISWLAEELLASQELCSVEWVSEFIVILLDIKIFLNVFV